MAEISDGLKVLRDAMSVKEIANLIERTARWVSPETFRLLPVWYPEYGRRELFYKGNWAEPQFNKNRKTGISTHKTEGNINANKALTHALGLRTKDRPHWSCCHIWGIDDPTFQLSNDVVADNRFYSCVGNMVLLPTPLKAFTDTMPDVKAMLRICARNLYDWRCDHKSLSEVNVTLDNWTSWDNYPASWPKNPNERKPLGTIELTSKIEKDAQARLARIRKDLKHAGQHYPREKVIEALEYWKIPIE